MDSITQAALGALCGELVLGRKLGNKGLLWGAAIGTLPDLDVLSAPLLSNIQELAFHRGISHSIFLMILLSPVLGWIVAKVHRHAEVGFYSASWFVFLAWSTHVLIDCFTTYGTQILQPFSNARISLNNFAIIDLFFLLPMVVGLALIWKRRKSDHSRYRIATKVGVWLIFYTALSFAVKLRANQVFEQEVARQGYQIGKFQSAPTLSNILLWRGLVDIGDEYLIGYWSLLDTDNEITFRRVKKNQALAKAWEGTEALSTLQWFAEDYWSAESHPDGSITITDLRFGEILSTDRAGNQTMASVFKWHLPLALPAHPATDPVVPVRLGKLDPSLHLRKMISRIFGDKEAFK